MNARTTPPAGWVTVAAAAAALTNGGDTIDASNVSRYLARNTDIPQEKRGKFRFVDLDALRRHRSSSLFVADKRLSRDIAAVEPMRTAVAPPVEDDGEDDAPVRGGSELQSTTLEIKQIELRRKRREEEVEQGRLVPLEDLQVVVAGMMAAFTGALAREEAALSSKLGREAGILIRQAHRAALTAATTRLIAAAKEQLHPVAVDQLQPSADTDVAAA